MNSSKSRTFTMKFGMDNAAFCDEEDRFVPGPEIVRILRHVADKVEAGIADGRVIDTNGNCVGDWKYTGT